MNDESNETAGAIMATEASESAGPEHPREASNEIVGAASPDAIAVRAYELFETRGREPGRDLDDWLRAEQELQGTRRVTAI
jgi:hypothetical protein